MVKTLPHDAHLVARVVTQVELCLLHVKAHARGLGHHLDVHGLARLHSDNQLVALRLALEDVARNVAVLDTHLGFTFI